MPDLSPKITIPAHPHQGMVDVYVISSPLVLLYANFFIQLQKKPAYLFVQPNTNYNFSHLEKSPYIKKIIVNQYRVGKPFKPFLLYKHLSDDLKANISEKKIRLYIPSDQAVFHLIPLIKFYTIVDTIILEEGSTFTNIRNKRIGPSRIRKIIQWFHLENLLLPLLVLYRYRIYFSREFFGLIKGHNLSFSEVYYFLLRWKYALTQKRVFNKFYEKNKYIKKLYLPFIDNRYLGQAKNKTEDLFKFIGQHPKTFKTASDYLLNSRLSFPEKIDNLFLSQPIDVDAGKVDLDTPKMIALIAKVFQKIDKNQNIYFKIHYREKIEKYKPLFDAFDNLYLLKEDYTLPYEIIHPKINPKRIISFFSSALYNVYGLYGFNNFIFINIPNAVYYKGFNKDIGLNAEYLP